MRPWNFISCARPHFLLRRLFLCKLCVWRLKQKSILCCSTWCAIGSKFLLKLLCFARQISSPRTVFILDLSLHNRVISKMIHVHLVSWTFNLNFFFIFCFDSCCSLIYFLLIHRSSCDFHIVYFYILFVIRLNAFSERNMSSFLCNLRMICRWSPKWLSVSIVEKAVHI